MNWTLRVKTEKEINDAVSQQSYYNHMVKGRSVIKSDICPLEVTKSNGEVKEVWDLSENEIVGLIEQMSREIEKGNKDQQRLMWAGQIVKCWGDKYKSFGPRTIANLMKVKENAKTPVGREVVRDFMGPLANKKLEEAMVVAQYLNGMQGNMKPATDAQVMQVLENMANMQEMSRSQN